MADKGAPSAGEHVWREIKVRVVPRAGTASTTVWVRRWRGAALVWDRRLSTFDLPAGSLENTSDLPGVLRAAAAALTDAADRMDHL